MRSTPALWSRGVRIPGDAGALDADLTVPPGALGVVVFAHGSGSGRLSERNRAVAAALQARGLATLLLDLLTPDEEARDRITLALRFDIPLLSARLVAAIDWVLADPALRAPIGLFGASTGAAAALVAAAQRPQTVRAVVSRGGRPDLAGPALAAVEAPTLLIVGGADHEVIALNRQAMGHLLSLTRIEIVPGATHLFEEPGALERVAELAGDWFTAHLPRGEPA